jgi:glycosidase
MLMSLIRGLAALGFIVGCCSALAAADGPSFAGWPRESIFYHVYVRSFADSDGDGKGDLPGLTAKLDYIASLGVDGLLLLPIFQNAYREYGGYATTDFAHVDAEYGGDAAWEKFIAEAHRRKLKVALDLSLTHVADTHPWFEAARKSPNAPERAHFIWAGPPRPAGNGVFGTPAWNPVEDGPSYFALYAPTVPHLNFRNPATAEAMIEVGAVWLARGADGFRLDSAPHVVPVDPSRPELISQSTEGAHEFWRRFMARMKSVKRSSFAVAEVLNGDPAQLAPYHADGIDMTFDYPTFFGLVSALTEGKKTNLALLVPATRDARPHGALGGVFLGNHDVPGEFIAPYGRVSDLVGGNRRRLQSAALLLFSLPATPFIYYGEEIGLRGGRSFNKDAAKLWSRNPMQWDDSRGRGFTAGKSWVPFAADKANVADQDGVEDTLLETYRGLIGVRRSSPALTRGGYREVPSGNEAVFAFLREDRKERVLVAVNFSADDVTVGVDLQAAGISQAQVNDRIFTHPYAAVTPANARAYPLELPAYQGRWLLLK